MSNDSITDKLDIYKSESSKANFIRKRVVVHEGHTLARVTAVEHEATAGG